jgi:hypothetical protein
MGKAQERIKALGRPSGGERESLKEAKPQEGNGSSYGLNHRSFENGYSKGTRP